MHASIAWATSSRTAGLDHLYERAAAAQWTEDDVDWSLGTPLSEIEYPFTATEAKALAVSPFADRGQEHWTVYRRALQSWSISQILYGEHGALAITGRLVETLPDAASKCLAASQCADEARHVRVLERYLTASGTSFSPSDQMTSLLSTLIGVSDWDQMFLGMQIVLEGIALAALRASDGMFRDPLLTDISRRIARDEARHLSFGVISLDEHLGGLTARERRERRDYVVEAVHLMFERFLLADVWEQLDVPAAEGRQYALTDANLVALRALLFTHVVKALRRIGMWDELRPTFESLSLVTAGRRRAAV